MYLTFFTIFSFEAFCTQAFKRVICSSPRKYLGYDTAKKNKATVKGIAYFISEKKPFGLKFRKIVFRDKSLIRK